MKPTLAQICSLNSPFEDDIADYAAGKCASIEVWFTKLESFLQSQAADDVRRLLEEHQVETPVASYQGGLLDSQGVAREESWRLFKARLDLCREFMIETMVVACDVAGPLNEQAIDRVRMSLAQAAEHAESAGVRLALEFQSTSEFGNNLQTAAALVDQTGSRQLGICLDAFHYYVGSSMSEDLALLTADNLFHVQLSDVADIPREFAADAHRILPGEGDIPLRSILDRLAEIEYDGAVSIELMNPQIWQIPALQFGEVAMTALHRILGLASME